MRPISPIRQTSSPHDNVGILYFKSILQGRFTFKLSQGYLVILSQDIRIRLRHNAKNSNHITVISPDWKQPSYEISRQQLQSLLSQAGLNQQQWSVWKNFLSLGKIPNPSKYSPDQLVEMFRSQLQRDYTSINESIDIVVSDNGTPHISFIFNQGFQFCPVKTLVYNGFLSDEVNIHLCRMAGISELVFWNSVDLSNKRISVNDLSYLSRV